MFTNWLQNRTARTGSWNYIYEYTSNLTHICTYLSWYKMPLDDNYLWLTNFFQYRDIYCSSKGMSQQRYGSVRQLLEVDRLKKNV